jgi:hypothetical protein
MATQQVWRKNKDGKLVKVESGNAIEGDWYEQYDEDGNRVKGEYAKGFVRAPQNNGSQPHSGQNVVIDQNIGGAGNRRRRAAARAREGRRIRESEERAAARRAGRQDKYEEALEYYERNKDKVGARPPSISQSDRDLDAYIRWHKPTAPSVQATHDRELKKEDARAAKHAKDSAWMEDRRKERLESLKKGATKLHDKSKPFAERQKENVASVRSELKPGESIETKTKEPLVSTHPDNKIMARPAARFDYGDGKKVALKDPLKEYRGKDGIVRNTPEVDAARRKPGYNPTRQQVETINAIEGDWYEQYDEDGNRVKGEYARGFVGDPYRRAAANQGDEAKNVSNLQQIGGAGVRRRTPAARAREGRRIAESEARMAKRRAAKRDKYEEALEYYERNKDKVGARPPSISQSDYDLDAYIRRAKPSKSESKAKPQTMSAPAKRRTPPAGVDITKPDAPPATEVKSGVSLANPGDAGNIYKPTDNERLRQQQERRGHPSTVVSPENATAMRDKEIRDFRPVEKPPSTAAKRLQDARKNPDKSAETWRLSNLLKLRSELKDNRHVIPTKSGQTVRNTIRQAHDSADGEKPLIKNWTSSVAERFRLKHATVPDWSRFHEVLEFHDNRTKREAAAAETPTNEQPQSPTAAPKPRKTPRRGLGMSNKT